MAQGHHRAIAQRQIDSLLRHSKSAFGEGAAERYRSLILTAINTLRSEPDHVAAKPTPVRRPTLMIHLRHFSRKAIPTERVASPRHLIVYRHSPGELEIVQILDDRMDLPKRLRC